ncbi:hypothetical protein HOLleu_28625 [Holothuria leucospilota]|uniref:Uncharacterized protein n=1 Tax=Holothuria leucospilota TaxID=206669 RepID=A0A9Q1BM89_HOLLE|nr:hypothetical protein HOLleu_28625 [Holothuria leucospilota]
MGISNGLRSLGSLPVESSHQPPGNGNCLNGSHTLETPSRRPPTHNPVRQLAHCFLHQPPRLHEMPVLKAENLGSAPGERDGRCPIQRNPTRNRMAPLPSLGQPYIQNFRAPDDRPLRIPDQCQVTNLLHQVFPPASLGNRPSCHLIRQHLRLRLPPPPWCLIQRVLLKLRDSNTTLFLVSPYWPNEPWFPILLEMLIDLPFKFPTKGNLLTQKGGKIWHQRLQHLHLAVWKLLSDTSPVKAFNMRLQSLHLGPQDLQPCRLTIHDSLDSDLGAPK